MFLPILNEEAGGGSNVYREYPETMMAIGRALQGLWKNPALRHVVQRGSEAALNGNIQLWVSNP